MADFRLQVFHVAAQLRSFTAAAERLHITQPAVSRHVRELEAEYQTRLFNRTANALTLTPAGELLFAHAGRILALYQQAAFEVGLLRHHLTGPLALGASTTLAQYVLPPLLAAFTERFPEVALELRAGNSREVEAQVLAGELHLGLVEGATHHPQLHYVPFAPDELVAVVATEHVALAGLDELTLDELRAQPLVLRERGSGTLQVLERALAAHQLRLPDLHVLLHLGSTEAIKAFLRYRPALGIVSVQAVRDELREGRLRVVEVPALDLRRQFHFVQAHGELGGVAAAFQRYASRQQERRA